MQSHTLEKGHGRIETREYFLETNKEDASRARKDNSPLNLNVLRKTALPLLKYADFGRIGIKKKLFRAALFQLVDQVDFPKGVCYAGKKERGSLPMEFKDTKTAENLQKALAGESIARNKYTYFAQVARANGDDEVAVAFEQMARNEMMHAKFWFEQLFGQPSDTRTCLTQAALGEYNEWHDMYPEFARQAREDGLEELAVMFEKVAAIEQSHEQRFLTLLARMRATVPETASAGTGVQAPAVRQPQSGWRCQFCGAIFQQRPDVCDTCGAIGSFDYVEE